MFGLPNAGPQDAANALTCADRMVAALAEWNAERSIEGEPPLAIGIGLNYGPAVIGDVGSEHSLSFTVIGDTVNTASRLQSLTRSLATAIVVGDPLVEAVKQTSSGTAAELLGSLEDIGEQNLRGRAGAIRAWMIRRAGVNGS